MLGVAQRQRLLFTTVGAWQLDETRPGGMVLGRRGTGSRARSGRHARVCAQPRLERQSELLNELKARLLEPAKCVPDCADYMAAQIAAAPANLEVTLQVASLSSVAVLRFRCVTVSNGCPFSIDGTAVPAYRTRTQLLLWMKSTRRARHGIHRPVTLRMQSRCSSVVPQVTVADAGWDISGVNASDCGAFASGWCRPRRLGRVRNIWDLMFPLLRARAASFRRDLGLAGQEGTRVELAEGKVPPCSFRC